MRHASALISIITALITGAVVWHLAGVIDTQRAILTQQATTLELWAHCPLPAPGTMLIVEANWPDQPEGERYRCGLTQKRPPLPKKLAQPLPRREP